MTQTLHDPIPAELRDLVQSLGDESDLSFPVEDPATTRTIAYVADSDATTATAAVDAAADAFPGWAATTPRHRSDVLHRAFTLMIARTEELAGLVALENGKALPDARAEVAYAAEFLRWYAEEAVRPEGAFGPASANGTRTIVTAKPIGVCALVTPWNFPLAMATRKIGPALAAGCTAVLKPAQETPLSALALEALLQEAGVPDGVLHVVPTTRAGEVVGTWLADPRVRKLSFTGSTGVGRLLLSQAADRVVSTSMELGGNAPLVVAADADVDVAVRGALVAKFRNGGQACTAANRFYVHADVAEEFTARFGAAVDALRVGSAFAPGTEVGPLISRSAYAGVSDWVDRAVAAGAMISHQARVHEDSGHFYPPTVLTGVPADAAVLDEEIFGPVAPIVTWRDYSSLLEAVNRTELGLASYVFSRDLQWALRFAERIDAGMVGINRGVVSDPSAPFGGTKQSGLGREGGREGIRAYTESQYLSVEWPA